MKTSASLFRSAALLAGLCLPTLFTGCAVMDPGSMQSDLTRIKNSQDKLSSKQTESFLEQQRKLNEIIDQLNLQQEMIKNLKSDMEKQLRDLRGATTPANVGGFRGTPGTPPGGEPAMAGGVATPAEDALLRQTADMYGKKDFVKCLETAEQFLTQYPDSANAPEVLFRKALCQFQLKNYAPAVDSCTILIAKYPASQFVPRAYHTKGSCELQLEKKPEARATFTKLRDTYPDYEPDTIKRIFAEYLDKK